MGGTHFLQTGYLLLNRNAPYCFLSKNNYSEPHSQNYLHEASFLLQYLSKFHAD